MIAIQQLICYRSSKLPVNVSESFLRNFRKGSSPEEWRDIPDKQQVLSLLLKTADIFEADYKNGFFAHLPDFPLAYNMPYGIQVKNFEEAVIFNNTHEAMHLSIIATRCKSIVRSS